MLEIRLLRPDEYEAAVRLSTATFQKPGQNSMGIRFPHVFSPSLGQCYGSFVKGELVSFTGLVPSIVRIGKSKLKVYSLGSVCTHPDHRGHGYASQILQDVLVHVTRAEASMLLVSGYRSLYTKVNCFRFGSVARFLVDPSIPAFQSVHNSSVTTTIRELQPTDWFRLHELASERPFIFQQSIWDLASLIHSEPFASCSNLSHKVLVAEEDSKLRAFAVFGVPKDANHQSSAVSIEWGGDVKTVLRLFVHAVIRFGLSELEVPVSWYETELIDALQFAKCQPDQNLGTVCIPNPERFIEQLRPYLEEKDSRLGHAIEVKTAEGGAVEVGCLSNNAVMQPASFVSFVFDPNPHIQWSQPLEELRKTFFPLPFPYTGGLTYV